MISGPIGKRNQPQEEELVAFRLLLSNLKEGILVLLLEEEGAARVLEINPSARRILGCLGTTFDFEAGTQEAAFLFDPEHLRMYHKTVMSGEGGEIGEIRKKSGEVEEIYSVRTVPLSKTAVALVFEDRSQSELTEQAFGALRALSTRLHTILDAEKLLEALVGGAASILKAEGGVAAFCTPEGVSCFRFLNKGRFVSSDECTFDGKLLCRAITVDYPYLSNDAANDPKIDRAVAARYGVDSVISTPIEDSDLEIIGFLEVHNKLGSKSGFDRFDEDQLAAISQAASTAMKNSLTYDELSRIGNTLQESTERLQLLIEGVNAIVWEADARSRQFTFVSRQAENVLGYPLKAWFSDPSFLANRMHPHDRDEAVAFCNRAIERGEDHELTYRVQAFDGHYVWFEEIVRVVKDANAIPVLLRGLFLDISCRIDVQEALRESEQRFRSTFDEAGIGIVLLDPKGLPLKTNPALLQLLGYKEEELAGLDIFLLNHPEDREKENLLFKKMMEGRGDRYQIEKRLVKKDGGIVWARVVVTLVRGASGSPEYAIAMVEDVTARKAAEDEVEALLAQVRESAAQLEQRIAERTSQLEEINTELRSFAYTVSHDLRAPLRAVQGFAQIIQDEEEGISTVGREAVSRILGASQRMDCLIQDLLAYSRISQQEVMLHPVSLGKVVEEALKHLDLERGDQPLVVEQTQNLPFVLGHFSMLTQVVLNLFTNAIKFMAPGVTPVIRVWSEPRGDNHRLFIKDNGIGIAAENQERIFKIFERLHGPEFYPGTGVGLAIVRKGVVRMGGAIGLESELGKGSTFWIELPKADVDASSVTDTTS